MGNETTIIIAAENCPLKYCKSDSVSVRLHQPDTQCNYDHSGILCGGCPPNLSTVLGSMQCFLSAVESQTSNNAFLSSSQSEHPKMDSFLS